jgi:hypothetical protein
MRKALCMLGMFVIAMSSASLAADSMRVYTQSGSQMTSIALSSINKITYDDYMMYFDTGATHDVVQRPVGGTVGNVKAIFTTGVKVKRFLINRPSIDAPVISYNVSAATIIFSLKSAGFMKAGVFSSEGKQVRELAASRLGAGEHLLSWNGTDANSRPVAPGVYHIIGSIDRNPTLNATIIVR